MRNRGYEKYEDTSSHWRNCELYHDGHAGTDTSANEPLTCAVLIMQQGQATPENAYINITE